MRRENQSLLYLSRKECYYEFYYKFYYEFYYEFQ